VRVGVPVNEGVRVGTWVDVGVASAGEFVGVRAGEKPPSLSLPQPASPTSRLIANKPALGAVNFAFLRFIGVHRYQPAWRMKSHDWSKCVVNRSGRPQRTPTRIGLPASPQSSQRQTRADCSANERVLRLRRWQARRRFRPVWSLCFTMAPAGSASAAYAGSWIMTLASSFGSRRYKALPPRSSGRRASPSRKHWKALPLQSGAATACVCSFARRRFWNSAGSSRFSHGGCGCSAGCRPRCSTSATASLPKYATGCSESPRRALGGTRTRRTVFSLELAAFSKTAALRWTEGVDTSPLQPPLRRKHWSLQWRRRPAHRIPPTTST